VSIFRKSVTIGIAFSLFLCLARLLEASMQVPVMVASFGATAVLLTSLQDHHAASFRNVVLGHMIAILIGLGCKAWIAPLSLEVALVIPITTSIAAMEFCRCVHPPGGAAALLILLSPPDVFGHATDAFIGVAIIGVPLLFLTVLAIRRFVDQLFGLKKKRRRSPAEGGVKSLSFKPRSFEKIHTKSPAQLLTIASHLPIYPITPSRTEILESRPNQPQQSCLMLTQSPW